MPPASQSLAARRFSFETATLWALLATLGIATIAFTTASSIPLLSTKSFILVIGTIVTLALFILARLSRGNVILPPPLLLGALWLPTLAYLLSSVFSGAGFSRSFLGPDFSPDTLGFMAVLSILGTLAALAFRRGSDYELFFKALFGLAIFIAIAQLLFVIVGQFPGSPISPNASIAGSVVDLASLAGLAVIATLLSMRLLTITGRARIMLFVVAAIALFVLALFSARLEWIIVAVVSLGLFVEAVMRRSPVGTDTDLEGTSVVAEAASGGDVGNQSMAAPLITLAIALFFLLGGNLSTMLANSLHVSVLDVRPSWGSTLEVGKQVYSETPVFGSGPSTFTSQWLKYRDASVNQTIFWNVDFNAGIGHIPTSFITTGLLGALAWLLLAGVLLYFGVRAIVLSTTTDPYLRFATTLSFAAAVYLGIVAVASNAGVISLALLFVFIGIFASTLRFAPGKMQWGIIFAKSPRIGFVIVFVLTIVLLASIVGAYGVVERYLAGLNLVRASNALASGNILVARSLVDTAVTLLPASDTYRLQAQVAQAEMTRIANDSSIPAATAQQSFQQALANGITAALNATRVAPNEYQNWVALGNLYATVVPLKVEGAYDNALAAYQKAEALNPTSPLIPYALARMEIDGQKPTEAQASLTRSIVLKQDYTPAIFLLSQLEVSTGHVAEALKAAEAAAYFTPNDAGILFQVGVLRAATGDAAGAIAALTSATAIDPQFANAHYFLAALYAKKADYATAKKELEAIGAINADNLKAVEPLIAELAANKNPFPANLLSVAPPSL